MTHHRSAEVGTARRDRRANCLCGFDLPGTGNGQDRTFISRFDALEVFDRAGKASDVHVF